MNDVPPTFLPRSTPLHWTHQIFCCRTPNSSGVIPVMIFEPDLAIQLRGVCELGKGRRGDSTVEVLRNQVWECPPLQIRIRQRDFDRCFDVGKGLSHQTH
ncbi:unnamed protein product [Somion occarium]|uniref:Uncharacterized protein n=1 Tax=Somion occarium TaxID=3059160 RepID=A0ABP1D2Z4_9APHY